MMNPIDDFSQSIPNPISMNLTVFSSGCFEGTTLGIIFGWPVDHMLKLVVVLFSMYKRVSISRVLDRESFI